jgi:arginyl-tRNA synthetase
MSQVPMSSFLGIFSATLSTVIPVKEKDKSEIKNEEENLEKKAEPKEEALGLGAVWYADLIEEIIDSRKK